MKTQRNIVQILKRSAEVYSNSSKQRAAKYEPAQFALGAHEWPEYTNRIEIDRNVLLCHMDRPIIPWLFRHSILHECRHFTFAQAEAFNMCGTCIYSHLPTISY